MKKRVRNFLHHQDKDFSDTHPVKNEDCKSSIHTDFDLPARKEGYFSDHKQIPFPPLKPASTSVTHERPTVEKKQLGTSPLFPLKNKLPLEISSLRCRGSLIWIGSFFVRREIVHCWRCRGRPRGLGLLNQDLE
jgi:hypothetical protein